MAPCSKYEAEASSNLCRHCGCWPHEHRRRSNFQEILGNRYVLLLTLATVCSAQTFSKVTATLTPDESTRSVYHLRDKLMSVYSVDVQNDLDVTFNATMAMTRRQSQNTVAISTRSSALLILMQSAGSNWKTIVSDAFGTSSQGASLLTASGIIAASNKYHVAFAIAPAVFQFLSNKFQDKLNPLALEKFDTESCPEKFTIDPHGSVLCVVIAKRYSKKQPEATFTVNLTR